MSLILISVGIALLVAIGTAILMFVFEAPELVAGFIVGFFILAILIYHSLLKMGFN